MDELTLVNTSVSVRGSVRGSVTVIYFIFFLLLIDAERLLAISAPVGQKHGISRIQHLVPSNVSLYGSACMT